MTQRKSLRLDNVLSNERDWRYHAKRGEYHKIEEPLFWEKAEKAAYLAHLKSVVPVRLYGDGVETFVDHINYWEAETIDLYCAASHLESLELRDVDVSKRHDVFDPRPLEPATQLAKSVLRRFGIDYSGMRETFVFWSKSRHRYVQIDQKLRAKLFAKGQLTLGFRFIDLHFDDLDESLSDLPERGTDPIGEGMYRREVMWKRKYPWRGGSINLYQLFRTRRLEPYTPIWHALNILWQYDFFVSTLDEFIWDRFEDSDEVRRQRDDWNPEIMLAAKTGLEIGISTDAIRKKDAEYKAVELEKAKRARTAASGQKSSRNRAKRIEALMVEIEALSSHFPDFDETVIVSQAARNAVDRDPILWRQGKGQMEIYLTEIRSEPKYRARYNEVFGRTA